MRTIGAAPIDAIDHAGRVVPLGRVAPGRGDLSRWIRVYADEYRRACGDALVPGSLNLVLDEGWSLPSGRLTLTAEKVGRLVHLVPCRVGNHGCFIFRTQLVEDTFGDEHRKLELLSSVRLRDELGVDDGDLVEVIVEERPIRNSTGSSGTSCA